MNTVHAPSLDAGLGWLNTDRPLRFNKELRGQIVVLDFWTYCCINCMHILPDLDFLEHKYEREPVVFLGVHSAKFTNEASPETIRAAIQRYEIKHPVVIDDQMKLWQAYAVRSWPTVVVVNAQGYVVGSVAGENNREALDQMIGQALAQGKANGTLAAGPLKIERDGMVRSASGLAFPGKVFADAELGRLFAADSNHNRIVVAEWPDDLGRAKVVQVVGSGEIGAADGPAEKATFNHPQGLVTGQGNLYVCDTENHLIRKIDLETYEVSTIVGTGKMTYDFAGGRMGRQQGINSPWDVVREGSTLYVAMAGQHQIWRVDLPVGFSRALAGTGRENIADGPTETSAFSQPSGICMMGGKLYVADSEVSAIRCIDMATERVSTILGEGLFSFGDEDGVFPKAKLQHPLGVAAHGSSLLVADTYNHKIKHVEPSSRSARTILGSGKPGTASSGGGLGFFEPGGLSVAGDELFVADTNNHRVIQLHLKTQEWRELIFEGLTSPVKVELEPTSQVLQAELAAHQDAQIEIEVALGAGFHLSTEAPWSVRVSSNGTTLAQQTGKSQSFPLRLTVPAVGVQPGLWLVEASFASCQSGSASHCVPHHYRWEVKLKNSGTSTPLKLTAAPGSR
jgi:thiol-disulfide isomerase/thioredoxin